MRYLTIIDAKQSLGVTRQALQQAIKRGTLKAKLLEIGGYRIYEIPEQEIERYRAENAGKVGRRPSKTRKA